MFIPKSWSCTKTQQITDLAYETSPTATVTTVTATSPLGDNSSHTKMCSEKVVAAASHWEMCYIVWMCMYILSCIASAGGLLVKAPAYGSKDPGFQSH